MSYSSTLCFIPQLLLSPYYVPDTEQGWEKRHSKSKRGHGPCHQGPTASLSRKGFIKRSDRGKSSEGKEHSSGRGCNWGPSGPGVSRFA